MIREEVWEIIEDSRKSGQFLQALNATFLTLIPKENKVTTPNHFRPIALCNVIYKLIMKVIAKRLKTILPFIISQEQSGYVEGKKIMDNIILAHKVIHSLQLTKSPGMLLKLDLSKDFDKLSWNYLKATLLAFGFILHGSPGLSISLCLPCSPSWLMACLPNPSPPPEVSDKGIHSHLFFSS
jgi:hypothetical protein